LNPVHHSLNLSVGYQNIPHEIEIDVSKLNLGGAIHLKDIQLPEDVSVLGVSAEETLVSILHPAGAESETKEGE
jgi:large subunit ribosomal protein L25